MKKAVQLLALFFLFSGTIKAQESRIVSEKIDSLLNGYIDSGIIPHANIVIVKNNNTILERAYGYKDISNKTELNLNHIFRLSSLSKLITSVAVMQLVDEGKINLNDPVEKYIPSFQHLNILDSINPETQDYLTHFASNKITIHHLLSNTSGISYGAAMDPKLGIIYNNNGIDIGYDTSNVSLQEKIETLAKLPTLHEPGEAWTYGFNYDVLGYLIEKVSGLPLDEYLQKNLFDRLEMNNTAFYLDSDKKKLLVPFHLYNKENKEFYSSSETPPLPYRMPFNYPIEGSQKYLSGGVGLNSSITDYTKLVKMLYKDGVYKKQQILSKESVQKITSNQIDSLPFMMPNMRWGYGTLVEKDNFRYWSEGGGYSYFKVDKEQDYIIVLFTQTMFSPYSTMKIFFQIDSIIQAD